MYPGLRLRVREDTPLGMCLWERVRGGVQVRRLRVREDTSLMCLWERVRGGVQVRRLRVREDTVLENCILCGRE